MNLGNTPENFIAAAYWQIAGVAPPAPFVTDHANRLRTWGYWRRIDVVNTILETVGPMKPRVYSDPWAGQPALMDAPCHSSGRDIGAVFMMFFNCPGGTNCGMHWANTHALGMDAAHSLLGFGGPPTGFYDPKTNAGFFYRELLDARYAGLQFLMPNVYGPDLSDGSIPNLVTALNAVNALAIGSEVQVGMFDDTWGWTNLPAPFNVEPDFSNPANAASAANLIFNNKWMPYFDAIPSAYWYRIAGRPIIYFYNAGTISPRTNSADVLSRLKVLFNTRYGVVPWLVVDIAFYDDPSMGTVADSSFTWKTVYNGLPLNKTRSTANGVVLDHAMVRWDPKGRDNGGATNQYASPADELIKGPEYLQILLQNSTDADVLVLASWNDLGEGTGVNRNFDYYYAGDWLKPTHFMDMIRHSQSQSLCPPLPGTPYGGTAIPIPGTVQAEDFDLGGELRAYHDLEAGNLGGAAYRPAEGVDLENCADAGGGYNIGYGKATEWAEYKVDVTVAGTYSVAARVATTAAGGVFHLEMDGVTFAGATLGNTGGGQAWATVLFGNLTLSAGTQTLRLALDTNSAVSGRVGSFNYFSFSLVVPTSTPTPTPSGTASPSATPSFTQTPTATPSPTASFSPTESPSPSQTPSATPSPTGTETPSESATLTQSASFSPSPSASSSPSPTETFSPGASPTPAPNASAPDVEKVLVSPNPALAGPGSAVGVSFLLKGDADEVEIRIYSPGYHLLNRFSAGPMTAGWASHQLSAFGPGNGAYFVVVRARSKSGSGKAAYGTLMLLK